MKSALVLSVVIVMTCSVLSFSSLDSDNNNNNNNVMVRIETLLSGSRKLSSCAEQGEMCGIKRCCEGLSCKGRKGCQPCASLGEMCGLISCCEGLLCYGREGCVLPAVVEAKESLKKLKLVQQQEALGSCLHRGEMCGILPKVCCEGLSCKGRKGCQPSCAQQGEMCGLLPNVCCEGLECDGINGCQPSCAKLGEICGIKQCCEGLLCYGREGCVLPAVVEAKESLNDML